VGFWAAFGRKVAPHDIGFDKRLRVNQFKSSRIQNQGHEPAARIETPLSGAIASCRQMTGMVGIVDRARDRAMQVLESQC